jgi:desulfoferrodoxin (superoxide reductase-like protein)
MKFGGFKIGKSKEGNRKENAASGVDTATKIAELEEKLNGRTNNLKQTEEQLKKLSVKGKKSKENDGVSVKPHGPIGELTLEPEDNPADLAATKEKKTGVVPEEGAENVKLVEVKVGTVPPPAEKETKVESIGDSFNSLFSQDEDDVNLLSGLIHTLPDVETNELLDDINEIKGIMKDWQKK